MARWATGTFRPSRSRPRSSAGCSRSSPAAPRSSGDGRPPWPSRATDGHSWAGSTPSTTWRSPPATPATDWVWPPRAPRTSPICWRSARRRASRPSHPRASPTWPRPEIVSWSSAASRSRFSLRHPFARPPLRPPVARSRRRSPPVASNCWPGAETRGYNPRSLHPARHALEARPPEPRREPPMELRSLDEIAHAAAAIVAGNLDALDRLVWTGVFGAEPARDAARAAVLDQCRSAGIYPASIHELYIARGRGEVPSNFTVPAINIRGLSYDTARALIRARRQLDAGAVICEIARSEITYTDQRPGEYVFVVLAAALREGWRGPVFIQGDHFQINAKKWAATPDAEI